MSGKAKASKKATASKRGSKQPSTAATKTTTVLDKIVFAIRALKSGPKGSSRQSVSKYLKSEFDYDNTNAINAALKKGVSSGKLVQSGQSFRVAADPVAEEAPAEGERLVAEDIKVGGGDSAAERGDTVTVAYVGTLDDGHQFDKASSFTFHLGAGDVIKGWDQGIVGMKKGGKRKLIVPSKLGYGKRGCKPDIPPNATLNFTVTLKQIK